MPRFVLFLFFLAAAATTCVSGITCGTGSSYNNATSSCDCDVGYTTFIGSGLGCNACNSTRGESGPRCRTCPAGRFSPEGTSTCLPCGVGSDPTYISTAHTGSGNSTFAVSYCSCLAGWGGFNALTSRRNPNYAGCDLCSTCQYSPALNEGASCRTCPAFTNATWGSSQCTIPLANRQNCTAGAPEAQVGAKFSMVSVPEPYYGATIYPDPKYGSGGASDIGQRMMVYNMYDCRQFVRVRLARVMETTMGGQVIKTSQYLGARGDYTYYGNTSPTPNQVIFFCSMPTVVATPTRPLRRIMQQTCGYQDMDSGLDPDGLRAFTVTVTYSGGDSQTSEGWHNFGPGLSNLPGMQVKVSGWKWVNYTQNIMAMVFEIDSSHPLATPTTRSMSVSGNYSLVRTSVGDGGVYHADASDPDWWSTSTSQNRGVRLLASVFSTSGNYSVMTETDDMHVFPPGISSTSASMPYFLSFIFLDINFTFPLDTIATPPLESCTPVVPANSTSSVNVTSPAWTPFNGTYPTSNVSSSSTGMPASSSGAAPSSSASPRSSSGMSSSSVGSSSSGVTSSSSAASPSSSSSGTSSSSTGSSSSSWPPTAVQQSDIFMSRRNHTRVTYVRNGTSVLLEDRFNCSRFELATVMSLDAYGMYIDIASRAVCTPHTNPTTWRCSFPFWHLTNALDIQYGPWDTLGSQDRVQLTVTIWATKWGTQSDAEFLLVTSHGNATLTQGNAVYLEYTTFVTLDASFDAMYPSSVPPVPGCLPSSLSLTRDQSTDTAWVSSTASPAAASSSSSTAMAGSSSSTGDALVAIPPVDDAVASIFGLSSPVSYAVAGVTVLGGVGTAYAVATRVFGLFQPKPAVGGRYSKLPRSKASLVH